MNKAQKKYVEKVKNPIAFKAYLWASLPSLAFWGAKIGAFDDNRCVVILKHNWRNKNPFRSIYFSALMGCAEISTGLLCQRYIQGEKWSMLVVKCSSEFTKKAVGKIRFVCDQGLELKKRLSQIKKTGTGTFEMMSIGLDQKDEEVGRFYFTWSFKYKGE